MAIDDLADRHHECDVLLDQNLYPDMDIRYCKKVPSYCWLLLGPNFALLRDEFRELRQLTKPRKEGVDRILIFFGGVDLANYTSIAIEALANLGGVQIVDVVIGDQHTNALSIKNACIKHGYRCHIQTSEMAKLMIDADLAIGAGGSASWERCCLGLPAILVAVSENQINIAEALNLVGACFYVGPKECIGLDEIQFAIKKILDSPESIVKMSRKAMSLVDGLGVIRICKALEMGI
jgi:UDP-2,4-diacetamido-2,4,6-trideoxy-beta-L-altropyranose hydrolase